MCRSKFILLDRDGVINRRIPDGYVTSWEEFVFLPRALDALRLLAQKGCSSLVVSNQACVGKGLLTPEGLEEINRRFVAQAEKYGGKISGIYCCPHRQEDECECRKPKPGLLLRAQREHQFNFADTFFVGDSETDLLAAHRVGCPMVFVGGTTTPDLGALHPNAVVPDLYGAVQWVLGSG